MDRDGHVTTTLNLQVTIDIALGNRCFKRFDVVVSNLFCDFDSPRWRLK